MPRTRVVWIAGLLLAAVALFAARDPVRSQDDSPPPGATRCDPASPISVELIPLNQPPPGRPVRFRVSVVSRLDPDLIRDLELRYELPEHVRATAQAAERPQAVRKTGQTDLELEVLLPDQARHPIRARVVAHLANGKTVSQTAVRWVGITEADQPEEMIGRIVDPDGTGIRVYRGETIKEPR